MTSFIAIAQELQRTGVVYVVALGAETPVPISLADYVALDDPAQELLGRAFPTFGLAEQYRRSRERMS